MLAGQQAAVDSPELYSESGVARLRHTVKVHPRMLGAAACTDVST